MPLPRCTCLLPLSLLAAPVLAFPVSYRIDPLAPPAGYVEAMPIAISDTGFISGRANAIDTFTDTAVVWDQKHVATPILPSSVSALAFAADVNNSGTSVGTTFSYPWLGTHTSFVRSANGDIRTWTVDDPGGFTFLPRRINASGLILGNFDQIPGSTLFDGTTFTRPHIFDPDPDILGDIPVDLNDSGEFIGIINRRGSFNERSEAFLHQSGTTTFIRNVFGPYTIASDLRNDGVILGISRHESTGEYQSFLWKDGVITPIARYPGATASIAGRINDSGTILGGATINGSVEPLIWFDGVPHLLNNLLPPDSDWYVSGVFGLNNLGQVIAQGYYRDGTQHALLLTPTPIPEPTSLLPFLLSPLLLRRR